MNPPFPAQAKDLVAALARFGKVTHVDPGTLPLADQLALVAEADVFVSRMSSQVILSMFMAPGGVAVEIEAPDPAKLYYDHVRGRASPQGRACPHATWSCLPV